MSWFKSLPLLFLPLFLISLNFAAATDTDPNLDELVFTPPVSELVTGITNEEVLEPDMMQSDTEREESNLDVEEVGSGSIPDLQTAETGSIDNNLVNDNFVGKYNANPCNELGKFLSLTC